MNIRKKGIETSMAWVDIFLNVTIIWLLTHTQTSYAEDWDLLISVPVLLSCVCFLAYCLTMLIHWHIIMRIHLSRATEQILFTIIMALISFFACWLTLRLLSATFNMANMEMKALSFICAIKASIIYVFFMLYEVWGCK